MTDEIILLESKDKPCNCRRIWTIIELASSDIVWLNVAVSGAKDK